MLNIGSLKSYGAGSILIRLAFIAACCEALFCCSDADPDEPSSSDESPCDDPDRGSRLLLLFALFLRSSANDTRCAAVPAPVASEDPA